MFAPDNFNRTFRCYICRQQHDAIVSVDHPRSLPQTGGGGSRGKSPYGSERPYIGVKWPHGGEKTPCR